MNYYLNKEYPSVMLIAEDSSDFPKVTASTLDGGLGFDYKWDLGWMNDTLKYYATDTLYRVYDHHKITFSMAYFYSERFMLPFSHDENVHGKKTIVDRMFGDYDMKFAQVRNLYAYMYAHPGKKLNFMGNEIASFREFDDCLGKCRYTKCTHLREEGCAVLAKMKDGGIAASRHDSYVRIYEEQRKVPEWKRRQLIEILWRNCCSCSGRWTRMLTGLLNCGRKTGRFPIGRLPKS